MKRRRPRHHREPADCATVRYHSIIGLYKPHGTLEQSSDGVVPYTSAHLAGAESGGVIPSWHSVQEMPAAILELRRILHLHLNRTERKQGSRQPDKRVVHAERSLQ